MNPVFWISIILILVFLWFVLSFMFPWLGTMFKRLWDDAMYNINGESQKENEEKGEEK